MVSLEKVDIFYLGDTLDTDDVCDLSVTTRVRSAWKNFRKQIPVELERVLVKTERQSICYLCEELSDAWQCDLAYESRA